MTFGNQRARDCVHPFNATVPHQLDTFLDTCCRNERDVEVVYPILGSRVSASERLHCGILSQGQRLLRAVCKALDRGLYPLPR